MLVRVQAQRQNIFQCADRKEVTNSEDLSLQMQVMCDPLMDYLAILKAKGTSRLTKTKSLREWTFNTKKKGKGSHIMNRK